MKSSICLNMIVRNERSVMKRCLESVLPWIDAWVVVDTGSSDGTQEVVREVLKDLPGALYERPWVDFSYNRTEALKLAKPWGDFALFIDADEELIVEKNFCWPDLQKMIYVTRVHLKELSAYRELLVDNRYDWYWEGVLHEQIYCRALINECGVIENAYNLSHPDSFRNLDREKFRKDADLLKKGLMKEPANSRYVFYLAQTLAAMGSWEEALGYYALRSRMGGWREEVYQSLYRIGFLQEVLSVPGKEIMASYWKAHRFEPRRAEPLFRIAYQLAIIGHYESARILSRVARALPFPDATYSFYIEPLIYRCWLKKLYADSCWNSGEIDEALCLYEELQSEKALSQEAIEQVKFCLFLPPEKRGALIKKFHF